VHDDDSKCRSDAICSSLQLINFWQDVAVDARKGRLYLPLSDCAQHGVDPASVLALSDSPAARGLIRAECDWARELMSSGAPLVHRVPGRAGWELRLVAQGGLRILDKIAALDFGTLVTRPRLRTADAAVVLWRGLQMRPQPAALAGSTA
jgi:phytoene/squalene synthetase